MAEVCLDAFPEAAPDCAVPLEVEVLVPNEYGGNYVRRKRWKTFREVYAAMHDYLNVLKCENCGEERNAPKQASWWNAKLPKCCDKCEWFHLIDEYDSCGTFRNEDAEIGNPDEFVQEIVCYAHVGGNEGYYANLDVLLGKYRADEKRHVHLYHIKSFRGMAHVHDLVKRMMKATGVWPSYAGDQ